MKVEGVDLEQDHGQKMAVRIQLIEPCKNLVVLEDRITRGSWYLDVRHSLPTTLGCHETGRVAQNQVE